MSPEEKDVIIDKANKKLKDLFAAYKNNEIDLVTLEEKVCTLFDMSMLFASLSSPRDNIKKNDNIRGGGSPGDPPPIG